MKPGATCIAAQQKEPPVSIIEFFRSLTGPRCGAPATVNTPAGPMCSECYLRIERGRRTGTNLLGVLEKAFRGNGSGDWKEDARLDGDGRRNVTRADEEAGKRRQ